MNFRIRTHSINMILVCVILSISSGYASQNTIRGIELPTRQPTVNSGPVAQQQASCTKFNCWVGIIPGLTTMDEAVRLLKIRYGTGSITINQENISWKNVSEDGEQGGNVSINEQSIVDEVEIYFAEKRWTVAEFIALAGEPQFVHIIRAFSTQTNCAGALMSYPDIGVIAWLYPVKASVGIQPSQSIQSVTFLGPEKARNWTITDQVKLNWHGYRDYCEMMDQNQIETF